MIVGRREFNRVLERLVTDLTHRMQDGTTVQTSCGQWIDTLEHRIGQCEKDILNMYQVLYNQKTISTKKTKKGKK